MAFGSEKFIKECRSVLGEVFAGGEPGPEDIVLLECSEIAGQNRFSEVKKYFPARVFVISPPSLEIWRSATEAGVTVMGSIEAVAARMGSQRGLCQKKRGWDSIRIGNDVKPELVGISELPDNITAGPGENNYAGKEHDGILLNAPQENKLPGVRGKKPGSLTFKRRGRLVCVYSLIGGVGKTTISLNMAELLRYHGKDVCLVDFDFNSAGSTAYFWPDAITPPESILLWEDFPIDMRESREIVEKFLAKVPFGFYMLPAPKEIMLSSLVSDVLPGTVLDVLLDHFDYVIVDMGTDMRQFGAKKALSMADKVLLVARPDDVSVSGAVRFLGHVGAGKLILPERMVFAVNRDRPRAPRRPKEVAEKAGLKLDFVLPDDELSLAEAARRHVLPVALKDSQLGNAIIVLTKGVIPEFEIKPMDKMPGLFLGALSSFISKHFKKKGVGCF